MKRATDQKLIDYLATTWDSQGKGHHIMGRWYENLPSLDTAYAIVTLCECQEFIESRAEGE